MSAISELVNMLGYRRPGGSETEQEFINRFLMPLKPTIDGYGNLIVKVGTSKVMWSSHVDTVHKTGGKQQIWRDDAWTRLWTDEKGSNCLGADCTTGVWLMVQMIRAQVPGLYVFHRDEETGGLGSNWIVKNTPQLVSGIEFCIAFDRKDTASVITYQFGERCCSDEFAASFEAIVGLGLKPDDTGSFTDSANYKGLIGECTNISVGYHRQHTAFEWQDVTFAMTLLAKMLAFDETKLVSSRKAGTYESKWKYQGYDWKSYRSEPRTEADRMSDFIYWNYKEVSKWLVEKGLTTAELRAEIFQRPLDEGEEEVIWDDAA